MTARKPTSVTLTLPALQLLFGAVIPCAGTDGELPVLTTVHLSMRGGYLVAATTDRFKAAFQRTVPTAVEGDFTALVKVTDAKHLLSILKPRKGQDSGDVKLTVNHLAGAPHTMTVEVVGGLAFEFTDLRLTVHLEPGEWPKVHALLGDNLTPEKLKKPVAHSSSVNAAYLSAFTTAAKLNGNQSLLLRGDTSGSPSKVGPVLFQVGEDFIGLLMTRRQLAPGDGAAPPTFGDGWADLLAEPTKGRQAS